MIIRGVFDGWMPCLVARIRWEGRELKTAFLAGTGAFRTTILDGDACRMGIVPTALPLAIHPLISIGGSAPVRLLHDVEICFDSDAGEFRVRQDLRVIQRDLSHLKPVERITGSEEDPCWDGTFSIGFA